MNKGKTVTIVEAIKQLYRLDAAERVLVMAPNNFAADLLLTRLSVVIGKSEMIRLMAYQRSKASVPVDVLDYSHYDTQVDGFTCLLTCL